MLGEKTLRQVRMDEPEVYAADLPRLKELRRDFLLHQAPPRLRITYYLEGGSGVGKTFLARLLAESLFPDLEPDEAYFEAGSPKVALQGYGGQECIIWDDYRPADLVMALNGRTAVWRAFDPAPGRAEENIKNGSIRLVHSVNIVTGVIPYEQFIEGLAGSYIDERTGKRFEAEDPKQAYRRVRFVHRVTPDEIEVLVNAGAIDRSADWRAYEHVMTMNANCRVLAETIEGLESEDQRSQFRRAVGNRVLGEMVRNHQNVRPQEQLTLDQAMSSLSAIEVTSGDELVRRKEWEASLVDVIEARTDEPWVEEYEVAEKELARRDRQPGISWGGQRPVISGPDCMISLPDHRPATAGLLLGGVS